MKIDQLSVFLENRAGRLAEVTRILSEANVNIRALSLADTTDFGILRLIVSDFDAAKTKLKESGFTVGRTSVVAVEVPDSPGGLNNILTMLNDSDINVEYMYPFVQKLSDNAALVFRFDRTDQGIELLQHNDVGILHGEAIHSI